MFELNANLWKQCQHLSQISMDYCLHKGYGIKHSLWSGLCARDGLAFIEQFWVAGIIAIYVASRIKLIEE